MTHIVDFAGNLSFMQNLHWLVCTGVNTPILVNKEKTLYLSLGDHCISSTELVCPTSGRWSTSHVPAWFGFQIWISLLQSPVARTLKSRYST